MDDEGPLLIAENEDEVPEILRTYNPQPTDDGEISKKTIFGYSLGHVFNDMCSSMWFTYLMIYLEKVIKMRSWRAGLLMLIGQVTDGIATPVIGLLSDSSILPHSIVKFGQRIPWHFFGFIMVTLSFPFVFNRCLLCKADTSENWTLAYYIPLVMMFQIGWASMQVNHLALIPTIAEQESCQRTLSTSRLSASVLANLTVFIILFIRFTLDSEDMIGPDDLTHFRSLAFIVVGAGVVVTIFFYILCREPPPQHYGEHLTIYQARINPKQYFKMPRFYTVAIIYMISRLYGNLSQVYFPLYITMTMNLPKTFLGILPMISYIFCFAVYTFMSSKCFNQRISRNPLLISGSFMAFIAAGLLYFKLPYWVIYLTAAIMGIAQSLLLTASFAFCNFLIGADKGSSAFIYGSMSFADKLVNGIVYQIIELINPSCNPHVEHEECAIFYRNIMVFIPGSCAAILAFFGILFVVSRIRIYFTPYNENNQNILLAGQRNT
uniref:Major facilitator superfamily domain-containing protein 12 n=1 Tax=Panagrolaimus sp. PS1159 TaxID=55785 RepID=A0AC35FNE4_9BILA